MSYLCSAKLNSDFCAACPTKASRKCPNIPGYQDMVQAELEVQAAFDAWKAAKTYLAVVQAEYLAAYHLFH